MKKRTRLVIAGSHGERGAMLITALATILFVGILGAALVPLVSGPAQSHLAANNADRVFYLAESGARYGIEILIANGPDGVAMIDGETFTLSGGETFTLAVDASSPPVYVLSSTAVVHSGLAAEARSRNYYTLQMSALPEGITTYEFGIFAGSGITMDSHSYVDSYDSEAGAWSSEGAGSNGHIGTNATTEDAINLSSNSTASGSAFVGVSGDVATTIEPGGGIDGMTAALQDALPMDPEEPPTNVTWVPLGDDDGYTLGGSTGVTLSAGHHEIDGDFTISSSTLTISGDVVIKIAGDMSWAGSYDIVIGADSSLTLYIDGNITINNYAGGSHSPGDFTIYSSGEHITLLGNTEFNGVIHAPNAVFTLGGNSQVFGSVFVDVAVLGSQCAIHYDESLGTGAIRTWMDGGGTEFVRSSLRAYQTPSGT